MTDITYVWITDGWAYLATILHVYSRAVIGWALDACLTPMLPLLALDNALRLGP